MAEAEDPVGQLMTAFAKLSSAVDGMLAAPVHDASAAAERLKTARDGAWSAVIALGQQRLNSNPKL